MVRAAASLFDLRFDTASVLTSKLFFVFAIYAFIKLGKAYFPKANPIALGSIAAFNPYAIYGNAGYTESLFLLLTSVFFTLLRSSNLVGAGLSGALLSATRLVGVTAMVPLAITVSSSWHQWRPSKRLTAVAGLALIPLGLLLFMLHLRHQTGDALAFIHIQKAWRGSGSGLGPFSWIGSLWRAFQTPGILYPYMAVSALVVLGISGAFLMHPRYRSLASFTVLSTLIPLSSDAWGMARYIWWQAPVLLFVAAITSRRKIYLLAWLILSLGANVACYRQWFSDIPWLIA